MNGFGNGNDAGRSNVRLKRTTTKRVAEAETAFSIPGTLIMSASQFDPAFPPAQGMYDPSAERDACGVGFVADLKNRKSHSIVEKGLEILLNLDHRGAVGADP